MCACTLASGVATWGLNHFQGHICCLSSMSVLLGQKAVFPALCSPMINHFPEEVRFLLVYPLTGTDEEKQRFECYFQTEKQ